MSRYLIELNNIEVTNLLTKGFIENEYGETLIEEVDKKIYDNIPGQSSLCGYFSGTEYLSRFMNDKDSIHLLEVELSDDEILKVTESVLNRFHNIDDVSIEELTNKYPTDMCLIKRIEGRHIVCLFTKYNEKTYCTQLTSIEHILKDIRDLNIKLKTLSKSNLWVNDKPEDLDTYHRDLLNEQEFYTKVYSLVDLTKIIDRRLEVIFKYMSYKYTDNTYTLKDIIYEIGLFDSIKHNVDRNNVLLEILKLNDFVAFLYQRVQSKYLVLQ